jgi:hypothetical protein
MQQRRGTQAQWTAANPVLGAGEIGFETDNNRFKIGDGTNAWSAISYFVDIESVLGGVSGTDLPAALDTLNEIAAALNDDAGLYNTLSNLINTGIQSVGNNLSVHAGDASNVHGVADMTDLTTTAYVTNAISNALTAHSDDTTNVHGIADVAALITTGNLPNALSTTLQTVANNLSQAISDHNADTSDVHGIANTNAIVYTTDSRLSDERTPSSSSVTAAKIASDAVETGKIANAAVTAVKLASNSVETAKIANGAVTDEKIANNIAQSHIANLTTDLGLLASQASVDLKAPLASPTFTGTVSGVTKSHVGLGNVDNTTDALKPVSSATQTALDLKAPLASPALTGTPTAPTANTLTNTTQIATTAFVQQEIAILTQSAPGLLNTLDELAAALGDDENFAATTANSIALKAPLASPTFTGTVSGITKSMVGLGSVDNTADTAKPVSTAQQTALDLKANLASPTFTGLVTVAANGIAYTDGTQTKEGVPSRTPIISKTASYTLSATSERDSLIEVSSGSGTTITIPLNSAVAFPIGTTLDILQTNTGQVTIAGDAGVTVNATPGLKLRTRWSSATLFKRDTNTWVAFGDLSA